MVLTKKSSSPVSASDESSPESEFWGAVELASAWSNRAASGACPFTISGAVTPASRSSMTAEFGSAESSAAPVFQLSGHATLGLVSLAALPYPSPSAAVISALVAASISSTMTANSAPTACASSSRSDR
jgi:hypothetical protein